MTKATPKPKPLPQRGGSYVRTDNGDLAPNDGKAKPEKEGK